MPTVFLSIGSNIEPEFHLQQCATTLKNHFTKTVWSPVYRSAAVGMDGNDFLNAVVVAHTDCSVESTVVVPTNSPAERSTSIYCCTTMLF